MIEWGGRDLGKRKYLLAFVGGCELYDLLGFATRQEDKIAIHLRLRIHLDEAVFGSVDSKLFWPDLVLPLLPGTTDLEARDLAWKEVGHLPIGPTLRLNVKLVVAPFDEGEFVEALRTLPGTHALAAYPN